MVYQSINWNSWADSQNFLFRQATLETEHWNRFTRCDTKYRTDSYTKCCTAIVDRAGADVYTAKYQLLLSDTFITFIK